MLPFKKYEHPFEKYVLPFEKYALTGVGYDNIGM
jgi:hypothetical protein